MATTRGKTISVARETAGFANINAATGLPWDDGLTYYALRARSVEGLETPGEWVVTESEEARDGPYMEPGEVDVKVELDGDQVPYRKGEVTVSSFYRGPGDGSVVASLNAHPLYIISQSGFAVEADDAQGNHDVIDNQVDANNFEPTTVTRFNAGNLIAFEHDGTMRGALVSKVTVAGDPDDRVRFTPSLSGGDEPADAGTVRVCKQLFAAMGQYMGSVGYSIALQVETATTLTKCYGGRLKTWKLSIDGNKVVIETTIYFPFIIDDHENAAAPASMACQPGQAARVGACPVISTADSPDCTPVAGVALTGSDLSVIAQSISITVENELALDDDLQTCDAVVRLPADIEITDTQVTVEFELAGNDETFKTLAVDRDHRMLVFAFGPFAEGTGMVVAVPAAVMRDPGKVGITKRITTRSVSMGAGRYVGDDGTGSATNASNAPLKIGFVNIDTP